MRLLPVEVRHEDHTLVNITLLAVQANAQDFEFAVPGDGAIWCPHEACDERWEEYKLTFDIDLGWYCRSKNRFCQSDGGGCGCSTTDPNTQTTVDGRWSWEMTGRLDGTHRRAINYEAEITEHVVDVCYLNRIRQMDDDELLVGEQETLELIKLLSAEEIRGMIELVLPLVTGQDRATRMAFYEVGAGMCIQAAR